ncbi:class III lanthionine synthetase LanKC [Bacillus sp. B1-b2]|uniref:class III lanthionine synthetase LanKC n=1 Tax=Bacillus sp. B1-b2 TaxID=2653201 RepID=UPI0012616BDE|nr:class III lanthionine synthetase LanKC [Bacillus sp. B1-b2]KAB7672197.1 protein kinase/lanthionine synthetase C family protein [Bacillus sp. B1-b2]
MEGNMLYYQYLKPNSLYFGKPKVREKENNYSLIDIPKNYVIISEKDSVWKHYHVKNSTLPEQGWKIHITSTLEESQKVLNIVARLCTDKMIEFKHLKDRHSYLNLNSKNANRASSGKFITIYPTNNNLFVELLDQLANLLKDTDKGPYILSDKRWKSSNVFYRYGGFKRILNKNGEYCVRDTNGNLVVDHRNPFYQAPEFVNEFDEYLDTINQSNESSNQVESKLEQYAMETALTYSNAGGVYLATRKSDGLKVIIKEARPKAGLDGFSDALARQKIEYEALKKLKDVSGVVNLIEYFQEWEHFFLVEEYIEGIDLRKWLALDFPFMGDSDSFSKHAKKVEKILTQLFKIVNNMHVNGVAMGDLQPANVIISDDLIVRLIDFETSLPVDSNERPTMQTIGFFSREMEFSGTRDWFGLKKLIKYMVLPVLTSEDLDEYLEGNHLEWIKQNYGYAFYHYIVKLQEECDARINLYQNYSSKELTDNGQVNANDLDKIIKMLIEGLENHLTEDERLINGDIRQFEVDGGKFNFLTGGSGAAFTLAKRNMAPLEIEKWIQNHLLETLPLIPENGLLSGKAGILSLLFEHGYDELVFSELKRMRENISDTDISLRSGIAGIGLFIISLYLKTKNIKYLNYAEFLESKIDYSRLENKESLKIKDWMGVNIGIIDGFSGVSLFYSALYSSTKKNDYLEKSKNLLKKDLESTTNDELAGVLQTLDDRNRALPYLSGGSIGIGIAIWFFNHVSGQECFDQELNAIINLSKTRCTVTGGLFDGAGSFLILPLLTNDLEYRELILKDVLNLLNIFLIKNNTCYSYPGQFSYRLSDDVYTGSSGIILALLGIKQNNPLYWLPIVQADDFVHQTKAANLIMN